MHIAIVFNPKSGQRPGDNTLAEVKAALSSQDHTLEVLNCQELPNIEEEIRQHAASFDRVVVIGGDGTLGATINAVTSSTTPDLPVAFAPTGRGKDTARSLGSWSADDMIRNKFESAECQPVDLIRMKLNTGVERYSINMSSIGLVADAARWAGNSPRLLGAFSYMIGAAWAFIPPKTFKLDMRIDGNHEVIDNALLLTACNGRALGGGFYLAPEADQTDGLLDFVVVQNASIVDLVLQLGKLKSGKAFDHPAITRWRGCSIEFEPIAHPYSEADGEVLPNQPVRYDIAPKALNWVTP